MKTPATDQMDFSIEWLEGALEWILGHYAQEKDRRILLICPSQPQVLLVQQRMRALWGKDRQIRVIPDVEYLPYDHYSPAQEGVAARLKALAEVGEDFPALVLSSPANVLHRLPPKTRLHAYTLRCAVGARFARQRWVQHLTANAYYAAEKVEEPGSFSVRGDVVDIFVHGVERPWRIDTLDDQVMSIRSFDPESGVTGDVVNSIDLTPGALVPFDDDALARFQSGFCALGAHAQDSAMYKTILNHRLAQGIESYFPLFYEETITVPELIDNQAEVMLMPGVRHVLEHYLDFSQHRYEDGRNDLERPLLAPSRLLLARPELKAWLKTSSVIDLDKVANQRRLRKDAGMELSAAPTLTVTPTRLPGEVDLFEYINKRKYRCIVCSSSTGRMSYQADILQERATGQIGTSKSLQQALTQPERVQITVAPFEHSFVDRGAGLVLVGESVFGSITRRSGRQTVVDELTRQGILLNSLDDLRPDEPLIHPEHGVGRYGGVVRLDVNAADAEFVLLNYAGGDKLYVPIDQVFLLDRYHLGESEDSAPWHTLRSSQWRKATRKARTGLDDLASKIIALHAARQKTTGLKHRIDPVLYQDFCSQFPYQETPDQRLTIQTILKEMQQGEIIDRLVVGEVGCGKTEVALRAVFVAVMNKHQAVVIAPTTILCQQHFERFRERLAQWDIKVGILSRFNQPQHRQVREQLQSGEINVLVATHAALSEKVRYKSLGLLVIDEEQRFGVRQKEKLKGYAANLNVIKLSATPIPRTLQMALNGLSTLSIIATMPPARRRVQTKILQWDDELIRRYCERELFRGGQVFVVNPRIRSLSRLRDRLVSLLPDARIAMVHGQNEAHEIEQAMLDFYHHHCDILVTTQIIENGVDFPSANTIIINDATAFGLASLHQLRGRVGRSHINAYAFLVVPPETILTPSARERLVNIKSHDAETQGFQLALADLDMRGAGTPLGKQQTGHENKVGYSVFMTELARTLSEHGSSLHEIFGVYEPQLVEVRTPAPAYLSDEYIASVSSRLRYYRAIHYASDARSLYELRAQLFELFGSLPPAAENLFNIAELKQKCQMLGAVAVVCTPNRTKIEFSTHHLIDLDKLLAWAMRHPARVVVGANSRIEIRHRRGGRDDDTDDEYKRAGAQVAFIGRVLDFLNRKPDSGEATAVKSTGVAITQVPDPLENDELTTRYAF